MEETDSRRLGVITSPCIHMHVQKLQRPRHHTQRDTLRAQSKKIKPSHAHAFLHHRFNTHRPCQYLMPHSLPGWYQLSFRDNVSDVSIPFPVSVHSPHWRRYNSPEDRTNDILAPLFSPCPPLKDSIMCNPMPRHNIASLDPFTAVSDNLDDRIAIHPRAYASLFFSSPDPPTYRGWHGQDGVIDLSKASCQRVAFGTQTALLPCSRQHSPWSGIRPAIICNSGDRSARHVMLCPWQPRRGGVIAFFKNIVVEGAFSALSSKDKRQNV